MIRAIIVDDELPSINMLKRLLNNTGKVDVIASFSDATKVIDFLSKEDIDVAFLDIEMPQINGLELANKISELYSKKKISCRVVFVTAYNQYAIEAFRVNALDYLLKPVNREILDSTLERIKKDEDINMASVKTRIDCFGKFGVYADGKQIKFRTKKAEELLALLIAFRGENVPRSRILDYLWSDFEGDKALINFNTTLYYLRKALQKSGIGVLIKYERESYKIIFDEIYCDYIEFYQFNINSSEINELNLMQVKSALELYIGDFLADSYEWALGVRLSMKEKYTNLVLGIVDYYVNKSENKKAIELLQSTFCVDNINDAVTYKIIQLLIKEKKYSLALEYFHTYENALKEMDRKIHKSFKKLIKKLKY